MYGSNQYGFAQYAGIGHITTAYTATYDEEVTITDDFTALTIIYKEVFSDIIDMTESLFKLDIRIFLDDISIANDTAIKATTRTFIDILNTFETIIKATVQYLSDLTTMTDSYLKGKAIENSDTSTITDSYSSTIELHQSLSETSTIEDSISAAKGRSLLDTIIMSETFRRFLNGLTSAWIKIDRTINSLWQKEAKH